MRDLFFLLGRKKSYSRRSRKGRYYRTTSASINFFGITARVTKRRKSSPFGALLGDSRGLMASLFWFLK